MRLNPLPLLAALIIPATLTVTFAAAQTAPPLASTTVEINAGDTATIPPAPATGGITVTNDTAVPSGKKVTVTYWLEGQVPDQKRRWLITCDPVSALTVADLQDGAEVQVGRNTTSTFSGDGGKVTEQAASAMGTVTSTGGIAVTTTTGTTNVTPANSPFTF